MAEFERRRMRVYLAGPMTQGDVFENVARAIRVGKQMVQDGLAPYIPQLDKYMTLGDESSISWNAFLEWDLEWVAASEAVYRIAGESKGADLEVRHARELGIPVYTEDSVYSFDGHEEVSAYNALLVYAGSKRMTGVRR